MNCCDSWGTQSYHTRRLDVLKERQLEAQGHTTKDVVSINTTPANAALCSRRAP